MIHTDNWFQRPQQLVLDTKSKILYFNEGYTFTKQ